MSETGRLEMKKLYLSAKHEDRLCRPDLEDTFYKRQNFQCQEEKG